MQRILKSNQIKYIFMTFLHEVNQQMSHSIIGSHLSYYVDRCCQSLNSSSFHIQQAHYVFLKLSLNFNLCVNVVKAAWIGLNRKCVLIESLGHPLVSPESQRTGWQWHVIEVEKRSGFWSVKRAVCPHHRTGRKGGRQSQTTSHT